jgi:spore germination protein KC
VKRGFIALLILSACALLAARGGQDVEEQAYVLSMGLDRVEGGALRVTLVLPATSGKGTDQQASDQSGMDGYEVVSAEGKTYVDALRTLRASIPKYLSFAQILQVVVCEHVARMPEFHDILKTVLITRCIRQSASLVVAKDNAEEFLKNQKPFLGIRLSSNLLTSFKLFEELDIIPITQLGEVVRMMDGGWADVVLAYGAVAGEPEPVEQAQLGRPLDKEAGMLLYEGSNKSDYLGTALFQEGRMVGTLTGKETQFLAYLTDQMGDNSLYVNGEYYAIEQMGKAKIRVDYEGDQMVLRVSGRISASVLLTGRGTEVLIRDAFSNEIVKLLSKLQKLGVDPVGFQGQAVRRVATLADWSQSDWQRAYEDARIEVTTHVTIGEAE